MNNEKESSPPHGRRYCLRCEAALRENFPECHRCHLQYDPHKRETYLAEKDFHRVEFWLPGWCFSILVGFITYAIVFLCFSKQGMGWALFFAVPTSFGAILGYKTGAIKLWWSLGLGFLAIICIVSAIMVSKISGMFCGLTLGLIFLLPVLLGITLGGILRTIMLDRIAQKFSFIPILVFIIFPIGNGYVENKIFTLSPPNTVQTSFVIDQPPLKVWKKIRFYEAIKGQPPLLLKLGLPQPQGTEGSADAVGSLTKCLYNKGHYIVKRINHLEEGRLLSFDVIEQHIHFEHDVTLLDGSFFLQPTAAGTTRIILTTRYQSRLRPTWLWKPMEEASITTLHRYVLENMKKDM